MRFMQELLKFTGFEGRLHLAWISSAEAQKFIQVVTEFTEKIKKLGPNPLSGKKIDRMLDQGIFPVEPEGIQGEKNANAG